jgi:hypothetical protein
MNQGGMMRTISLQTDPDLAGLRDPAPLAKLPDPEQEVCRKLWADVAALLKKAQEAKK